MSTSEPDAGTSASMRPNADTESETSAAWAWVWAWILQHRSASGPACAWPETEETHDSLLECMGHAMMMEVESTKGKGLKTLEAFAKAMDVTETGGAVLEEFGGAGILRVSRQAVWRCLDRAANALAVPLDVFGDPYAALSQKRPSWTVMSPPSAAATSEASLRDARYRRSLRIARWAVSEVEVDKGDQGKCKENEKQEAEKIGVRLVVALTSLVSQHGTWCSDATRHFAGETLNAVAKWIGVDAVDGLVLQWQPYILDWAVSTVLPQRRGGGQEERAQARTEGGSAHASTSFPHLCAFVVLCRMLKHPNVSPALGPIIAIALNACDHVAPVMKVLGVQLIDVCVRELNAAELRWHADVIMDELGSLLRFKDPELMRIVVPTAASAAIVLDPSGPDVGRGTVRHLPVVLGALRREVGLASSAESRRVYARVIPRVFRAQGTAMTGLLREWMPALFDQLLCGDSEVTGLTLEAFGVLFRACWPRIPAHQALLFQALCQCYISISDTDTASSGKPYSNFNSRPDTASSTGDSETHLGLDLDHIPNDPNPNQRGIEDLLLELRSIGLSAKDRRKRGEEASLYISTPDSDWDTLLQEAESVPPLANLVKRLRMR